MVWLPTRNTIGGTLRDTGRVATLTIHAARAKAVKAFQPGMGPPKDGQQAAQPGMTMPGKADEWRCPRNALPVLGSKPLVFSRVEVLEFHSNQEAGSGRQKYVARRGWHAAAAFPPLPPAWSGPVRESTAHPG